MTFVMLSFDDAPRWIRAAAITAVYPSDASAGSMIETMHSGTFDVDQSAAEILALLAEQRTVTHAMHTAAINEAAARSWYVSQKLMDDLRAILEAALAVRAP